MAAQIRPASVSVRRARLWLPHPKYRTATQHHLVASRMREAKARKALVRRERDMRNQLKAAVDQVCASGFKRDGFSLVCGGAGAHGRLRKGLQIVIRCARQKNVRHALSFTSMLEMSFNGITRTKDVAHAVKLNPRWVQRVRHSVCAAILSAEQRELSQIQGWLAESSPRGLVYVTSLAFDETTEKLRLKFPAPVSSSWHILVSLQHSLFSVISAAGTVESMFVEHLRPPIPLASTTAEAIWSGLFDQKPAKPFGSLTSSAIGAAEYAAFHIDRDGASSNDKLVEKMFSEQPPTLLICDRVCGSHCNQLCESAATLAMSDSLVPVLYSISLLLRMGSYFLRLHAALDRWVESMLTPASIRRGPPPIEASRYADEMGDFVLRSFICQQQHKRQQADGGLGHDPQSDLDPDLDFAPDMDDRSPSVRDFKCAWNEFRSVANGHFSEGLRHYCSSWECCRGYDINVTRLRAKAAITKLCFSTLPMVPSQGKWTTTYPCWLYYVRCLCLCSVLQGVWYIAFGKLSQTIVVDSKSDDPSYQIEISFHAVASKRVRAGRELIKRESTPELLLIFAIVVEPFRWLTGWFLHFSSPTRRARRHFWRCPPICLLTSAEHSPLVRILEYFSCLLSGIAPRLRLLFGRGGFHTFEAWCAAKPSLLAILRRGVTVGASWLHRRLVAGGSGIGWPWRLSQLIHLRCAQEERVRIAREFLGFPWHALDKHFSQRLRSLVGSPEQLLSKPIQVLLHQWSWSIRCSIAPVECMHGRNRRRSCQDLRWPEFAARCLLGEASLRSQQRIEDDAERKRRLSRYAGPPSPAVQNFKPRRVRKKTALELFRVDYAQEKKASGQHWNPVTREAWVEVSKAYEALPEDRKSIYQALADASLSAADARARNAALQAPALPAPASTPSVDQNLAIVPLGPQPAASLPVQIRPLRSELVGLHRPGPAGPAGDGSQHDDRLPMSAEALANYWQDSKASIKGASMAFAASQDSLGVQSSSSWPPMPRSSPARSELGARSGAPPLHAGVVNTMQGLVFRAGGFGKAFNDLLIVAIEIEVAHASSTLYGHIASVAGKAGGKECRMNVIVCEKVRPSRFNSHYAGARLRYRRRAGMAALPLHFDQTLEAHRVGMCEHVSEQEFAVPALDSFPHIGRSCKYRVRRLNASLVAGDMFELLDEGEVFEAAAPPPPSMQRPADDGDIDWFDALRPRKKPKPTASSSGGATEPQRAISPPPLEGGVAEVGDLEGLLGERFDELDRQFREFDRLEIEVPPSDSEGEASGADPDDGPESHVARSASDVVAEPAMPASSSSSSAALLVVEPRGVEPVPSQESQALRLGACLTEFVSVHEAEVICNELGFSLSEFWVLTRNARNPKGG